MNQHAACIMWIRICAPNVGGFSRIPKISVAQRRDVRPRAGPSTNTGRMRRDGQEFATSSCLPGQHAKACRQDRGRAASESPKIRPKTPVQASDITQPHTLVPHVPHTARPAARQRAPDRAQGLYRRASAPRGATLPTNLQCPHCLRHSVSRRETIGHVQCACPSLERARIAAHHHIWRSLLAMLAASSKPTLVPSGTKWTKRKGRPGIKKG